MQATTTMNSISAVHNTAQSTEQAVSTSESQPFAVQLDQSMAQTKKQTQQQKGNQSGEQIIHLEEAQLNAELGELVAAEQTESTEDIAEEEFHPEAAALFQQPFIAAEEALQFPFKAEAQPVSSIEEQAPIQSLPESEFGAVMEGTAPKQPTSDLQMEGLQAAVVSGEETQQQAVIPFEEEKVQTFMGKTGLQSSLEPLEKVQGELKDPAVEPAKTTISVEKGTAENSPVREIAAQPAFKPEVNEVKFAEQQVNEEFAVDAKQDIVPELENQSKEMNDLDLQSDFRMKVSLPKVDGSFKEVATVQPAIAQVEPQVNVTLTGGKEAVNQQKLTQTVTDMMLQQVETTTVQQGQQTTARVQITPETLGNITIEMQLTDNQLQTTIVVESAEVKEMLDKRMQQLTQILAQKNISMQEPTIRLTQPQEMNLSFAENSSQQKQQQESKQSVMHLEHREEPIHQPAAEEADTPAGRVSILA